MSFETLVLHLFVSLLFTLLYFQMVLNKIQGNGPDIFENVYFISKMSITEHV